MKAHKHDDHREDTRIALLEQSINTINQTLIRFENRFDQLDNKIEKLRFSSWSQFQWLIAFIIGGFVGTWTILSHVFHWV